jgi:hypothetical protein
MKEGSAFEFVIAAILSWVLFSVVWLIFTFLAPFSGWFEIVMRWTWILATVAFATLTLTRIAYFLIKGK